MNFCCCGACEFNLNISFQAVESDTESCILSASAFWNPGDTDCPACVVFLIFQVVKVLSAKIVGGALFKERGEIGSEEAGLGDDGVSNEVLGDCIPGSDLVNGGLILVVLIKKLPYVSESRGAVIGCGSRVG
jgi:hypothetical protein